MALLVAGKTTDESMGLNILLVDSRGHECEEYRWWDSIRYSGDREFMAADLNWKRQEADGDLVGRPPDTAEAWVRAHVVAGNRPRLLALLAFLRQHPEAWLLASW